LRLTPKGRAVGLVDDGRWGIFEARRTRFDLNLAKLRSTVVKDSFGASLPATLWLRQPATKIATLVEAGQLELEQPVQRLDIATVETSIKYEGYLRRQEADIAKRSREENRRIPREFHYARVPGLSTEVIQRLSQIQPETLGQALRVPGVTPAAMAVLSSYLSRPI